MAEAKDVLDYLRNQQKAAEIDAKINGVNLWVLFGAIAVISWQLTDQSSMVWENSEFAWRSMMLAVTIHMLSMMLRGDVADRKELRFSRETIHGEQPYLSVVYGALLIIPAAFVGQLVEHRVFYFISALICSVPLFLGMHAIFASILSKTNDKKFPLVQLGAPRGGVALVGVAMTLLFGILLVDQVDYFFYRSEANRLDLRQMGLLSAGYFLLILCADRRFFSGSIEWTYRLETDIVVGAISPAEAVKRIESRRLGSKLQDVVEGFFVVLDERVRQFDEILARCQEAVQEVQKIPKEFSIERSSRMKSVTHELTTHVLEVEKDYLEFENYLEKLEAKNFGEAKARLYPMLTGLKTRLREYRPNVDRMKLALKRVQDE